MTTSIGTQASVLAGFLALVVAISMNSIQEDDGHLYRLFVGGIGLASLGPIFIVLLFSVLEPTGGVNQTRALVFTLVSLFLIFILLIGTLLKESRRGLDSDDDNWYMILLGIFVSFWYLILYTIF
ncbi:hypothetical protein [Halorubrum aquaticum]|uniref:hypothetical protein n=1 Tax=Halorubrum aquaticum TaxID=387340 RepID=UPI00122CA448|nr:hypothetical protein [Halorubrum aquaticum]